MLTKITITNDGSYERKFEIFNGDNKIILETNKPVIFTYSFFDLIDEIGNFQSQMNKIYELLELIIQHLKTFLCSAQA